MTAPPEAAASRRRRRPAHRPRPILAEDRCGFTLIEVLAAMVVFTMGVLAVAQTTVVLDLVGDRGGERSEMVLFSSQRLDSLRTVSYASLDTGTVADTVQGERAPYRITVRVLDAGTRARELRVTTETLEPTGQPLTFHSYQVEPLSTTTTTSSSSTW